jgi:APA family basic amino acid/polyamine antiporter
VVLRYKQPDVPRPFKVPLVPLLPLLGAGVCIVQMASLPWNTWMRLIIWTLLGFAIYFGYGIRHSKLNQKRRKN